MAEYELSEHARDMLKERNIQPAWVESALEKPDRKQTREDGTIHYVKAIEQQEGRYLRVVVNPGRKPPRVVTFFFDRRLGRSYET